MTIEGVLGEYLTVPDSGSIPIVCSVELMDSSRQFGTVSAACVVQVAGYLSPASRRIQATELRNMLASRDPGTRERATRSLGVVNRATALTLLTAACRDSNVHVVLAAVHVAGDMQDSKKAAGIVDRLTRHSDPTVRWEAIYEQSRRRRSGKE